jgi:hypothetical protein
MESTRLVGVSGPSRVAPVPVGGLGALGCEIAKIFASFEPRRDLNPRRQWAESSA